MPNPLDLIKAFHVSKANCYFDGDPMPYIMSLKVPSVASPVESFDNTSTGGPIEVADPYRKYVNGDGEVKYEQENAALVQKLMDSSKLQQVKFAMAVSALNPQLGEFLPLPATYAIGAQFFDCDPGVLAQGKKREGTAKYKMMTLKIDINLITVINFDFVNASFEVGPADLLALVGAII
jgi:phage tail tube protein FII